MRSFVSSDVEWCGVVSGGSGGLPETSWRVLGPPGWSWRSLGVLLGALGEVLGGLGTLLGALGSLLGQSWTALRRYWCAPRTILDAPWRCDELLMGTTETSNTTDFCCCSDVGLIPGSGFGVS